MSVALTERQVRDQTKTVTRRLGWQNLRPGDILTLCGKIMGRRRGEPVVRIVDVEIMSVRRERLAAITPNDVIAEGFPDMSPAQFVEFFTSAHRDCYPHSEVTRIEWRYLYEPTTQPGLF